MNPHDQEFQSPGAQADELHSQAAPENFGSPELAHFLGVLGHALAERWQLLVTNSASLEGVTNRKKKGKLTGSPRVDRV
jgi:hypothetical protein